MARSALTPQPFVTAGLAPTTVTPDAEGVSFRNNGKMILMVTNGSASDITVTPKIAKTIEGVTPTSPARTVAARRHQVPRPVRGGHLPAAVLDGRDVRGLLRCHRRRRGAAPTPVKGGAVADWNLNYGTFERLPEDRKVQADLDRRAEAARAAADVVCPRSEDGRNGQDPGHLASTIRIERRGVARRVLYGNDTTAAYAVIIEWGSRRHMIYPRNGKYLRWVDPQTGRVIFARKVDHPGTRPYRVMSGAALEAARNA
ncbi:hypothetical protein [Actinomadura madurae]|uniref:hypothetical protein n=1 Tax=Actinomadura madurae TaxID=1993 RepID=UPI0020D1F671|nr:hypothetical protein [Actinomadura madurae]MCQ0012708.1 hypothetical protein [Actinomadura madurae]